MARKLITPADGLEACLFLEDGRGLRGINLLRSSGPRGECLSVSIHDANGKRKSINSFSLRERDFYEQWGRAVWAICEHYGIEKDSPMHKEMLASSAAFLSRYKISLEPVTVVYQQARLAA